MAIFVLQPGSSGEDTYINSFNSDTNFGSVTTMQVGRNLISGSQHSYKSLIRFDLSSFGSDFIISSATLTLTALTVEGSGTYNLQRSLVQWFESESTWNERHATNNLSWAGGAGGTSLSDYSTVIDSNVIASPAEYDFDVTLHIQVFVDGTNTNFGWWLTGPVTDDTNAIFGTSDNSTVSVRPKLTIVGKAVRSRIGNIEGISTASGTLSTLIGEIVNFEIQPNSAAGKDTTIASSVPDNNFGSYFIFTAGTNTHSLIQFDLSDIPEYAVVLSATLSLYSNTPTSTPAAVSIYKSLVEWFEGDAVNSTTSIDGSTWNFRNHIGSVPWAGGVGGAAGDDYANTPTDSTDINGTGFFTWDVTTDVVGFIEDPSSNKGWRLIGASTRDFFSSDETQADRRPKIVVTFFIRNIYGGSLGSSQASATGSLKGYLRGLSEGEASGEGLAITNELLTGLAEGAATHLAVIKGIGGVAGSTSGSTTQQADAYVVHYMQAVVAGTSSVSALIKSNEWLVSTGEGSSIASASISSTGYLRSSRIFTASSDAFLSARWYMEANLSVMGVAAGDPTGKFRVEGSTAGTSIVVAQPDFLGRLRSHINGTSSISGTMFNSYQGWGNTYTACNSTPLLYITDGSVRPNGQLNLLNFLSEGSGFKLRSWRPKISQYKEGGRFSNGPLAQGRRLRYRNFDNVIETFELTAIGQDQDALIEFQQELMGWQEAAADYWISDFVVNPVYLVAKAARETYERYAIIHMISVPELENPYTEPFFGRQNSVFDTITPQIERGHWLSTPPGQFECVPISSIRSWTVSGWESGS